MADERDHSRPKTARLSDEALQRMRARAGGLQEGERVSLLIYHRDGVRAVPLTPGRRLTIGRFAPADLVIRDSSLSAAHATIGLEDGSVWVEDLGSTNGTRVDGEIIGREKVEPGMELQLGAVVAAVFVAGSMEEQRTDLVSHDRLMRELEIEVERARAYGRECALLLLQHPRKHVSKWLPRVRPLLRPFERAALYSTDTIEILLPEATAADVRKKAEAALEIGVRGGGAVFPAHATTAEEMVDAARSALQSTTRTDRIRLAGEGEPDVPGARPIVRSAAMQQVFNTVGRLATSVIPVLILGETGTGKEVLARAVHDGGPRRGNPLISVNCGGIPPQLVESTLFGHERGAFTGAERKSAGIFESAQGGTVLLDEIGELPAPAQAALLRILESRRFTRVGSTTEIEADVRVLAATHRDLEAMCDDGTFRRDLFYRLEAMTIQLPPLRERPEEVEPLTKRFLAMANETNGRSVAGIEPAAMALLREYRWPGNIRELRNAIERAVVIAQDDQITRDDLPQRVRQMAPPAPPPEQPGPSTEGRTLKEELLELEARLILAALKEAGWDRKRAAEALSLPLRTLAHKMQVHGIRRRSYGMDYTNE